MNIQTNTFIELINTVKGYASTDKFRTTIQFIKLDVKHNSITAEAIDGYIAIRHTVDIENNDEFTAFIPVTQLPTIKQDKSCVQEVELVLNNDILTITISNDNNKVKYCYVQPKEEWFDFDKYFPKKEDRKYFAIDAKRLHTAIKPFLKKNNSHCLEFFIGEPMQPILINAGGYNRKSEMIVLPMRVNK